MYVAYGNQQIIIADLCLKNIKKKKYFILFDLNTRTEQLQQNIDNSAIGVVLKKQ